MKILVSACLLGHRCRYDGSEKVYPQVAALAKKHTLIPVCPEVDGGLSVPREPCEIRDGKVYTKSGTDCTDAFRRGAETALETARREGCTVAVLKERSPSCGHKIIHDGSFTGALAEGDGICASLLAANGITVYGENETDKIK